MMPFAAGSKPPKERKTIPVGNKSPKWWSPFPRLKRLRWLGKRRRGVKPIESTRGWKNAKRVLGANLADFLSGSKGHAYGRIGLKCIGFSPFETKSLGKNTVKVRLEWSSNKLGPGKSERYADLRFTRIKEEQGAQTIEVEVSPSQTGLGEDQHFRGGINSFLKEFQMRLPAEVKVEIQQY